MQNPAIVKKSDGTEIVLPLTFEDFQIILNQESSRDIKNELFKAYYQNKNHTAYRYFLEDNKWLSPEAVHGVIKVDGYTKTLFQEFADLFALTFVACSDTTIEGISGETQKIGWTSGLCK